MILVFWQECKNDLKMALQSTFWRLQQSLQNRVPRVQVLLPLPSIFGFGKRFPKPFFFSYTKTYTILSGVQVNGIIKSLNRFSLCCFPPIDIYSLCSLYALVSQQYRNILNRYAVIVKNTCH